MAKEGKTLVFVEVKTRKVIEGDPPQAAVNVRKQNRLGKLAHGYLKSKRMRETPCRFDVVAVIVNDDGGRQGHPSHSERVLRSLPGREPAGGPPSEAPDNTPRPHD